MSLVSSAKVCLLSMLLPVFSVQAQAPARILYPQQTSGLGYGWSVDGQGKLGMNIPAAGVPGEIPIPVVLRYNATYSQGWQTYTKYVTKIVNHTITDYAVTANGIFDRDIYATLHFGGIFH